MANFKTHLTITVIASTILSESFLSIGFFTIYDAMIAFMIGILGGLLPDVDSEYSTSLKWVSTILSVTMISIALEKTLHHYSLIEMLILSVIIIFFIQFPLIKLIKVFSSHRGMFHSIPVAIIFGLIITITSQNFLSVKPSISWLYGLILTSTYLLHLITDELYSIDIKNKRLKHSFGSAFKLFKLKNSTDKMYTFFVYLLLFNLLYLVSNNKLLMNVTSIFYI